MILIDTNILLYAVNRDDERSLAAGKGLESILNGSARGVLSWSVVYEFMRVATHLRVFSKPLDVETAWAFIAEIIRHPNCLILTETKIHPETVEQCIRDAPRLHGNLLHDFHLAVFMREHGIKQIMTEDRDFLMFPWVDIVKLPVE